MKSGREILQDLSENEDKNGTKVQLIEDIIQVGTYQANAKL